MEDDGGTTMSNPDPVGAVDVEALSVLAQRAKECYPIGKSVDEDGYLSCPMCDGEGSVEMTTHRPESHHAAGIQVFGIGADLTALEAYVAAMSPDVTLAMCRELKRLREGLEHVSFYAARRGRGAISETPEEMLGTIVSVCDRILRDTAPQAEEK